MSLSGHLSESSVKTCQISTPQKPIKKQCKSDRGTDRHTDGRTDGHREEFRLGRPLSRADHFKKYPVHGAKHASPPSLQSMYMACDRITDQPHLYSALY